MLGLVSAVAGSSGGVGGADPNNYYSYSAQGHRFTGAARFAAGGQQLEEARAEWRRRHPKPAEKENV